MTVALIVLVVILVIAVAVLAVPRLVHRTPPLSPSSRTDRRILFPFVVEDLSRPALDAALRLAAAEQATLVPVFLARVSLDLPLDAPLPHQCGIALPLLEAIEQRATEAGVPVDSRIERGRNRRHALRHAIATERFDRIVMAAASQGSHGFDADDVAWLLENAPGEIVVLRPAGPQAERALPVGPPSSEAHGRSGWQARSRPAHVRSEWDARPNRADEMAGSR